ncbi:MAG: hypothetical protein MJZ29_02440 [Bacteroidaceae bacterium]|nr:hypothetical protein [Bacteroidaceae bacterium]
MKKKNYKKPSAKVIIVEAESLLDTISGTGESGTIDWSAPKIKETLIDDSREDIEEISQINSVYILNNK